MSFPLKNWPLKDLPLHLLEKDLPTSEICNRLLKLIENPKIFNIQWIKKWYKTVTLLWQDSKSTKFKLDFKNFIAIVAKILPDNCFQVVQLNEIIMLIFKYFFDYGERWLQICIKRLKLKLNVFKGNIPEYLAMMAILLNNYHVRCCIGDNVDVFF